MKRIGWSLAAVIALLAVAGLLRWGFSRHQTGEQKEQEPAVKEPSYIKKSTNGEVSVNLDAATQQRIGLQLEAAIATNVLSEIKCYGRVLDPGPLATLVNELAGAQTSLEASRTEFERLKTLQEQNNASARALQTAQAAAKRDEILVRSAQDRLTLGYGAAIAHRQDLPVFVQALVSAQELLVRVDLPAGEHWQRSLPTARLVGLGVRPSAELAQFLGPMPMVDPQTQAESLLFVISNKALPLAPGAAVTAYLPVSSEKISGVLVPRDAIVRFESRAWVYVQSTATSFVRQAVELEHPLEQGWLITAGLKPESKLVVTGAQQLLSAERLGNGSGD